MSLSAEALLARAERTVELALARGAHEAECYAVAGAGIEADIEGGEVASTSRSEAVGAGLRVVLGGRVGFAYFTADDQVEAAIGRALEHTRPAPAKGYSLPFPRRSAPLPGRFDERLAGLDEGMLLDAASALVAGAEAACPGATVAGGGVGIDADLVAIASSHGAAWWDRSTSLGCHASLVLEEGGRAVSADESAGSHRLDLDAEAVGRAAGERLRSLRNPRPVEAGGRFDVVLRPEAVSELVADLAVSAATGDEAMRGRTLWSGRLGARVGSAELTLADDPRHPGALGGVPFDDEGMATGRVPLVEAGVLRNYLYDSSDAHRHGSATTASAVRGGFKGLPETGAHHLVASCKTTRPLDALVAGVDDGFLVQGVLGAHTANVATGEFSVTAPAVWRIRKGAVEGACREIALAGGLGDLLGKVDGASAEAKRMPGALLPAFRVRGLSVSV